MSNVEATRPADVLAFFDLPGTSNGPTEAINGRLEHLRGSALGFRNLANYTARSLLEAGGFRPLATPWIPEEAVIHFSGHSDEDSIEFEDETDAPHDGVIVTAGAFASAVQATDQPPILIMLNSCLSAAQLERLVSKVVPFAIGTWQTRSTMAMRSPMQRASTRTSPMVNPSTQRMLLVVPHWNLAGA